MKFEELISSSLKSSISFTTMFFKVTFTKYKKFSFYHSTEHFSESRGNPLGQNRAGKRQQNHFQTGKLFHFILTMQRIVFKIIVNIGEVDRIQHFC